MNNKIHDDLPDNELAFQIATKRIVNMLYKLLQERISQGLLFDDTDDWEAKERYYKEVEKLFGDAEESSDDPEKDAD